MRLLSRRRQARLDERIGRAVEEETKPIGASDVSDDYCRVLMSAVSAAGGALSEFLSTVRGDSWSPELDAFVKRIDNGADIVPVLRVVAWAYVNQVIDGAHRERGGEALDAARDALGFRSDWEERIARLDPREGTKGDAGMMLRFNRTVYEAMIASVNGESGESSVDLPGITAWSAAFGGNWSLYQLMLDHLSGR